MIRLEIRVDGRSYNGRIGFDGGFWSDMPNGENRAWAETQARELLDNSRLSSIEDSENLRGVALADHGFCLSALR